MTDRDRIAKVLWKTFQNTPPIEATDEEWETWWTQGGDQEQKFYYLQADAVIAELGLRPEWGALAHDDSGFLYDRREEVKPSPGETVKTRYITEWTDDDE